MKIAGFIVQLASLILIFVVFFGVHFTSENVSFFKMRMEGNDCMNRINHDLTQEQIYKLQDQVQELRAEIRQLKGK